MSTRNPAARSGVNMVMSSRKVLISVLTVAAAAYLLFTLWGRRQVPRTAAPKQALWNAEMEALYGGSAVRILHFYSGENHLIEGGSANLCYGVVNARSVRIEPPVPGALVAISHCVEVSPEEDTRYTLFAEGKDGQTISASFVLPVHPDEFRLPRVTEFKIMGHQVEQGRHIFSLSFKTENPEEVSIQPAVFPTLYGAPYGHFYVAPEKTTTYTLTVSDKKGRKAYKQLIVPVPGR